MMRRVVIEPPMEEHDVVALTPVEELAAAATLPLPRRHEWLAWRALVRRELGPEVKISYNTLGAPEVSVAGVYISVSHCKGRIAVCFSDARCAVDIESEARNFSRAASRYMTARERALSDDPLLPCAVWCAKEALYKYAGRQELDLLNDLHITGVDLAACQIVGRINDEELIELSIVRRDGFFAAYIL